MGRRNARTKQKNTIFFFAIWTMLGLSIGGYVFNWEITNEQSEAKATINNEIREEGNQQLLSYIDKGLEAVSRGLVSPRGTPEDSIAVLSGFVDAAYPMIAAVDTTEAHDMEGEGDQQGAKVATETAEPVQQSPDTKATKPAVVASEIPKETPKQMKIDASKPVVIIYHTHATESYLPVSEGNFHAIAEKATVRQVGDALEKELEAQGIQVIHDKTLHDSPSYNKSYNRSLETIKGLIASTKAPKIVIDLHRDAAGYTKNQPQIATVDGSKVAKYGFVVGTQNENVKALRVLADYMIEKSNKKYPGIARDVIEKPYKFNEYVSDYYMLLEVGNNQNHIDESVAAAQCFGKVLAEAIKDNWK